MNNIEQVEITQKDLNGMDLYEFYSISSEIGIHFGTYCYYREPGESLDYPDEAVCLISIRRSNLSSKQASQKKWDEFFAKHVISLTTIRFKN